MALPEELTAELRIKFNRYSTAVDPSARMINCSGFLFLLKSCPNTTLSSVPEERLEALFLEASGPGSTKRSSKLSFDAFMTLLGALGREIFGSSGASLLCLVLQCLLPHKLFEPQYSSLLDTLTSGGSSSSGSSSSDSSRGSGGGAGGAATRSPSGVSARGAPAPSSASGSSRIVTTSPPSVGAWAAAAAAESARSVQAQRAASPAPSAGAAAPPTPTLEAFLEAARLADFAAPLRNMGATSIVDLIDLTALDFTRLGMKDLQRRRLKDALARYSIGGSGMAAASPTPSLSDPEPAGQGVGSATASAAEAEAAAPPPAASAGAGRRFEDWDEYENADGYLYYHSRSTGATMWERPSGPHIVLHTLAERAAAFASAAAGVDVQPVPVQHERSLARGSSSSSSSSGMASGGASGATSAGVWERMYSTEPLSVHSSRAPAVLLPSDKVRLELARRAGMSAGMGAAGGAGAQDPASASSAQPLAFSSSEHNHDTSFERRGPLVNAPVHPYVSSRSRSVVEERSLGGAGALGVEGDKESLGQGGRRGYAHSAPLTSLGPGSAVLLAPSQLTPRPTSSAVYRELVTEGSSSSGAPMSASHVYADVLDGLPVMHPATAEVLARSHSVANPRIMGYADRRPDITPRGGLGGAVGRVNSDHVGERVMFTESGSAGVASGRWASGLRPQLYTPSKDTAASPGRVGWEGGGERGGGVESVGYAYKHAAAASQWAGAGSVYDRLCDPRGYTGLHKHRFDTDGRGKGMRGRDDTGTSADMRYIDASFPADVRVKGEDGKVRVIPANSTPWTLELPGYSGFGTARGMGRKGVKGVL